MKSKSLINFKRMFLVPLFLTTIFTLILGLSMFFLTSQIYMDTYTTTGKNYAQAYALTLERNHDFEVHLIDDLQVRLTDSAQTVISERANLSNEKLAEIAFETKVEYLWWYSPTGEVLYDSTGQYVGWTPTEGDPIDSFIKLDQDVYFEGIRKFTENDSYIMVLYMRDVDDYFIQVAINVDTVVGHLEAVSYDSVIEQVFDSNDQVVYAYIENNMGEILADSRDNPTLITNQDTDIRTRVLGGEIVSHLTDDPDLDARIIQIYAPIYHQDTVVEVLVIGYTLASYNQFINFAGLIIGLIGFSIIALYLSLQFVLVVRPLQKLSTSIHSFDAKTGHYNRPTKGVRVINKLFASVDELSAKIKESNEENSKLNLEINRLAYIDFLTEIPNRISLEKYLNIKIDKNIQFSLIFIDIDEFKNYNDTKGHVFGDTLLTHAANVFKKLQAEYNFYVARYGGDEFVIVKDYQKIEDVDKAIDGIYQAFEVPVKIDDIDYSLGLSIGISSHPNHGSKISDLIRKADIAMYQSKRLSTNRQVYYQDYMEQEILDETKIKDTLKRALKNDGFKIVVQPQYCLETKAIISYEALARLKESPTPPNRFIFVAEKYNLINELGRVIIVKAIQTLAHMAENGIELRPIYVNLSAKQLSDTTLVPFILQQLENHHISPQFFGIELTESTLIDNEVFAQNFLDNIRELGIKIALDDFGSGQAGLNYLTKYPLQMVKLDRAFSLNYLSEEKLDTYRMLVNFAVLLGFKVLAEGIEEEGQISLLKQTAVTMVQGYVYSRPLEVEDLIVKIKQNLLP